MARLSDGSWSAPSAIAMVGGGFGGQIGFELTDFVFILNNAAAVKTFAQQGSLNFGANISLAAGPVGRNAEASGAASLKSVAAVFAYSKTKGLFAGVSLEGGGFVERRDANEKEYGSRIKAVQLLEGGIRPTASADPLMRVLNSRVFAGVATSTYSNGDSMYNDIPVYDDRHDDVVWEGRRGSAYGEGIARDQTGDSFATRPSRAATWQDDVYDRDAIGSNASIAPSRRDTISSRANPNETFDALARRNTGSSLDNYSYSDNPSNTSPISPKPGRPTAPKPVFKSRNTSQLEKNQAIALFTFDADQPGDLGFKKGEVITIVKRTEGSSADWWTGRVGDREGTFPRYADTHFFLSSSLGLRRMPAHKRCVWKLTSLSAAVITSKLCRPSFRPAHLSLSRLLNCASSGSEPSKPLALVQLVSPYMQGISFQKSDELYFLQ